jgi:hypothetical protein
MRDHLTPVGMVIMARQEIAIVGKEVEEGKPLCPVDSHYGKQVWRFLKKVKRMAS